MVAPSKSCANSVVCTCRSVRSLVHMVIPPSHPFSSVKSEVHLTGRRREKFAYPSRPTSIIIILSNLLLLLLFTYISHSLDSLIYFAMAGHPILCLILSLHSILGRTNRHYTAKARVCSFIRSRDGKI